MMRVSRGKVGLVGAAIIEKIEPNRAPGIEAMMRRNGEVIMGGVGGDGCMRTIAGEACGAETMRTIMSTGIANTTSADPGVAATGIAGVSSAAITDLAP
jgi:hypothetical protein